MITVAARPEPVSIDPERTAVLVVDMQNDISGVTTAASATRGLLSAAREVGIPVVYLRMEHEPDLSDIGPTDGPHWIKNHPDGVGDIVTAPDGSRSRILVRGTWNSEILDELAPESGDRVVSKHRYSGFFE